MLFNIIVLGSAAPEGMGLISVPYWSFSHPLPREEAMECLGLLEIQAFILISTSWYGLILGTAKSCTGNGMAWALQQSLFFVGVCFMHLDELRRICGKQRSVRKIYWQTIIFLETSAVLIILTAFHLQVEFFIYFLGPDCWGNEYMVKYNEWSCWRWPWACR